MTFTLPTRHRSNRDAEIYRLYHKAGYLRMRIARIFDCRMREVNEALARQQMRLTARSGKGHARRRPAPVTLARVSVLEGAE